ncbi:MAG: response regulator transcription factor [Phycisphaerae bacterium]|nr:response regulator transcription factor [Phycisphaerae bacterium]
MRLLVVEDDREMAKYLKRGLQEAGYAVDVASDGEDGLHQGLSGEYDAVVLDLMLPVRDGVSLVTEWRGRDLRMPIIILTARDAITDRVRGLDAGADDYLVKPFSFAELLARLRALLRRGPAGGETELRAADLRMDLAAHRAFRGREELDLTPKEFALLEYLLRHAGQVVTRTMIINHVWNYDFDPGTNVVDVHVRRLRLKVDEGRKVRLIHTVRGVGYVLKP